MDKLDKIFEEHLEDTYVDNDLGGNELVRVIYERDLKDLKEQLTIHSVSHQRELFLDLLRFNEEYFEKGNCEWLNEEVLDEWLKSKNCG